MSEPCEQCEGMNERVAQYLRLDYWLFWSIMQRCFSNLFSSYSVVASYHYHGAKSEGLYKYVGLQTRITSTLLWSFKFAIAFTHAPPSNYFATAMECIFGCTLIDETMTITNTHGSFEKIYDFLTILYSWIVGRVLQVAYCSMVML